MNPDAEDACSPSEGFETPEAAALAGWLSTPSAHARVVSVEPNPNPEHGGVWVTVQTDGHPGFHDQDIVHCHQAPDGSWIEVGSFPA